MGGKLSAAKIEPRVWTGRDWVHIDLTGLPPPLRLRFSLRPPLTTLPASTQSAINRALANPCFGGTMDPHGLSQASDAAPDSDTPSCQGCRRRKLKCSREQPICSHCKRLESPCVYDLKKNKPGIKAGAVGSLSRRVGGFEHGVSSHCLTDRTIQRHSSKPFWIGRKMNLSVARQTETTDLPMDPMMLSKYCPCSLQSFKSSAHSLGGVRPCVSTNISGTNPWFPLQHPRALVDRHRTVRIGHLSNALVILHGKDGVWTVAATRMSTSCYPWKKAWNVHRQIFLPLI